jgi:uncharacterized lipoprotein YbaY
MRLLQLALALAVLLAACGNNSGGATPPATTLPAATAAPSGQEAPAAYPAPGSYPAP